MMIMVKTIMIYDDDDDDDNDSVYKNKEVKALFKAQPRKISAIRKTKKHTKRTKEEEALDKKDKHHTKVNAHYYKEHHKQHEKQDAKNKAEGKKDMFALN